MIHENINSYEYLIKEHQGLVYHIVNRFHVSAFDRDDLIQSGMMGLLEAVKRYDINRDVAFSTYAIPYIMGSVKKEYYKQNSVISSEYYRRLIVNVQKNLDKCSYLELAQKYHTTVENIIMALNFSNHIEYLKEEELEMIPDTKKQDIELDTSMLDKEELVIYHMRIIQQMTQKDIADKLHINQSTISRKLKNIAQKVLIKV